MSISESSSRLELADDGGREEGTGGAGEVGSDVSRALPTSVAHAVNEGDSTSTACMSLVLLDMMVVWMKSTAGTLSLKYKMVRDYDNEIF